MNEELEAIERLWSFSRNPDVMARVQAAFRILGRPADMEVLDVNVAARLQEAQAVAIRMDLRDPEIRSRVHTLLTTIGRCHELLKGLLRLDTPPIPVSDDPAHPESKAVARTILLDRLYDELVMRRTRLREDRVYVRKKTAAGVPSIFWVESGDILSFSYDSFDKFRSEEYYRMFTGHGGESLNLHVHVQNSAKDIRMPRISRDRHVFSFENGVYVARLLDKMLVAPPADGPAHGMRQRFFRYDGEHELLMPEVCAAQHFEGLNFDEEVYARVMENDDWRSIPTANLDSVLHHQDIVGEAYDWALFFIGRLLYSLKSVDNLQVIPYILGVAGSGKSTILQDVVGRFYTAEDVGILGNTSEKTFGIWPLLDKLLFYCAEVKHDFELNQGIFQQMVAGEKVTVPIKHKLARSIDWTAPGILAGNEVFGYKDASGSLLRRVVVLDFKRHVQVRDPLLPQRLREEIPNIIFKTNMAYHWGIRTLDGRDFWNLGIDYFRQTSKAFSSRVDPLRALFEDEDNDSVVIAPRNPRVFCPIGTVVKRLKDMRVTVTSKGVRDHVIFSSRPRDFAILDVRDPGLPYPRVGHGRHARRGGFVFGFDVRAEGMDADGMPEYGEVEISPEILEQANGAFE